jgi:hypothetical protein
MHLVAPPLNSNEDIPPSKALAIFIAPCLVFILLIVAFWTLYRKGVLVHCCRFKKKRKKTVLPMKKSITSEQKSQVSNQHSIPEYSEWLESVHTSQTDDLSNASITQNKIPLQEFNKFTTTADYAMTTPPPTALTTDSKSPPTSGSHHHHNPQAVGDLYYPNTHILGAVQKNAWKLGALKYTTREQRKLQKSDDSNLLKKDSHVFWLNRKESDDSAASRSWWSRKSHPSLAESHHSSGQYYDQFNVW